MAASCSVRPQECLGGGNKAFLDARRGVRAAPGPAPPRRPMRRQDGQAPTMSVPGNQSRRPKRGRQRGRRSSPAAAGSTTQKKKPVMENVVILKRGEQLQPKLTVVARKLALPPAAAKSGAEGEMVSEPVVAMNQRGAQAEKAGKENAEPVIGADQHGPDTRAKKKAEAGEQPGADATTKAKALASAADQCVPPAKAEKEVVKHVPVVTARKKRSGSEMRVKAAPRVVYSGPSFVAAPEPSELPIPVLLLKGLGARLRPHDNVRAAPTAAAA